MLSSTTCCAGPLTRGSLEDLTYLNACLLVLCCCLCACAVSSSSSSLKHSMASTAEAAKSACYSGQQLIGGKRRNLRPHTLLLSQESMRLVPPLSGFVRETTKAYTFSGAADPRRGSLWHAALGLCFATSCSFAAAAAAAAAAACQHSRCRRDHRQGDQDLQLGVLRTARREHLPRAGRLCARALAERLRRREPGGLGAFR